MQENMVQLWKMFLRIWTIQDKAPSQYQHLNTRSTFNNMVQQLACNFTDQRMMKWITSTLSISLMSMNGSHIMKATDQTMLIFSMITTTVQDGIDEWLLIHNDRRLCDIHMSKPKGRLTPEYLAQLCKCGIEASRKIIEATTCRNYRNTVK